jgi:hypothetical protein
MFRKPYIRSLRFIARWSSNKVEAITDLHPFNDQFNQNYAAGIEFAAGEAYHLISSHHATAIEVQESLLWHANYYKEP